MVVVVVGRLDQNMPGPIFCPSLALVIQDVHVFFSSFIPEKHFRIFLHIVDFIGGQQFEGPNCSFNAASKGSTPSQLRNKGLI